MSFSLDENPELAYKITYQCNPELNEEGIFYSPLDISDKMGDVMADFVYKTFWRMPGKYRLIIETGGTRYELECKEALKVIKK